MKLDPRFWRRPGYRTGDDDENMDDDEDDDDEFGFLSNYEKERQQMNSQIQQLEREVMDEESDDDDGTNMSKA